MGGFEEWNGKCNHNLKNNETNFKNKLNAFILRRKNKDTIKTKKYPN